MQSIPIATLSPQSASPSSASSTSSTLSGPFPSAASSTSAGSSSLSSPSSPRAKSKRSAAHMREFVRNYFLRNSASLVNKDLTSISAELQAAYEKETASGDGTIDSNSGGDRKPVFCRTFIQKVARSLGFILTLHFGLVDKRMKHLMKIRKRGKKNGKKQQQQQSASQTAATHSLHSSDKLKAEAKHDSLIKHEQQQQQQRKQGQAVEQRPDVVEDELAAAARHMEQMAAALEARSVRGLGGDGAQSIKEEPAHDAAVDEDDEEAEAEVEAEDNDDEDANEVMDSAAATVATTASDSMDSPPDEAASVEETETATKMDV